ncbi:MAG: ABC transporter substrate-binding protein [Chitinophagaceae bacterium]
MLKAGVLYPRSGTFPLLGDNFLKGIRAALGFHENSDSIEWLNQGIDFGANEKEVYQKAELLLVGEQVDILIAFLDPRMADILKPLVQATGKFFILVNSGANLPDNWVPSPGTLNLTLQNSFLCRLTGLWAGAGDTTHKAVMAASFYDGGYAHTASMVNAYKESGGTIGFNFISTQRIQEFSISPLQAFLTDNPGNRTLLALFSGTEANLFLNQLQDSGQRTGLQLFVSPMMLEEKNCASLNTTFTFPVKGYIPWHSGLDHEANRIFRQSFHAQSGRDADLFSLLGWETGLILHRLFENRLLPAPGKEILSWLKENSLDTPRGKMRIHPSTHYCLAPVVQAFLQADNIVGIESILDDPTVEWETFISRENGSGQAGWLNTYLCY